MEIGVVVHGPGIIDSGWALRIIELLSTMGNVRCRLGGTIGRTAVIDAALENVIDISLKLLPSESLVLFNRENVDLIVLLNYGKSSETGQVFGYNAFNHYFRKISNEEYLATNYKPLYDLKIPVIQIERPGEEDGSIISWNVILNKYLSEKSKKSFFEKNTKDSNNILSFDFKELFDDLRQILNLNKVTPEEVRSLYFSKDIREDDSKYVGELVKSSEYYDELNDYTYRKIHGVSSGENIFVNGHIIGFARCDSIVLVAENGIIIDIIGGVIKPHGVEKLGTIDLNNVIVKTGLLRKATNITPRILYDDISIEESQLAIITEWDYFRVAYVDHAAYDIYRFKDCDLVVTVGDDTTLIASDILYRFNIPIVGITDGDLDKVVETGFISDKSTIIEVASGFDDVVGRYIHEKLFCSKDIIEFEFSESYESVEEFKLHMLTKFKSNLIEVVKEVVPSFIEKDLDELCSGNYINAIISDTTESTESDDLIKSDGLNNAYSEDDVDSVENVSLDDVYVDESTGEFVSGPIDSEYGSIGGEYENSVNQSTEGHVEELSEGYSNEKSYDD